MTALSISLLAYNQRADLERLLPTLLPAAARARAEILLVDYRSQDGTDELLAARPEINVVRNDKKAGYGANHNINLRRAESDFFVIMNTDMIMHDLDLFVRLRDHMERHPDIGILGIKVLNEDGSIQGLNKRYPTVLDLGLRGFAPSAVKNMCRRRLDYFEMRDVGYDQECDVEFISGAFMFCRTDVLRRLGGFNPAYFLYFEDVDMCRRVQRTHRTAYVPWASITHFWQRDAHRKLSHTIYFMQSALRYFGTWGLRLA